jgi:L-ascorbate metabolism protein UlaG (beta-lactamase superfamily)
MQLTKLGHSCVRLEKGGATLVIDPGMWSEPDALSGANAVLVTHEHGDHLNPDEIRAALTANGSLELWSTEPVVAQFAEFGGRVHAVSAGDAFTAAGFDVVVSGGQHARIVSQIPVIPNVGFAVDDKVYHPGDSFTLPGRPVDALLVPVSAPWLKFSEVAEYIAAAGASRGFAIHDAVLSENGLTLVNQLLKVVSGGQVGRVAPGTTVEL